jgi:hypothetical protein
MIISSNPSPLRSPAAETFHPKRSPGLSPETVTRVPLLPKLEGAKKSRVIDINTIREIAIITQKTTELLFLVFNYVIPPNLCHVLSVISYLTYSLSPIIIHWYKYTFRVNANLTGCESAFKLAYM